MMTLISAPAAEPVDLRSAGRWRIVCILLVGTVAAWALPFFKVAPADYLDFLLPWYEHIQTAGVVGAFAHPFSNYAPPYLYLLAALTSLPLPPLIAIKSLSAVGSLWAAYAVFRLLAAAGAAQRVEAGIAALLLPTILLNAPVLGQADMFWVAPCLFVIAAAYRGNTFSMVLWAGIGFSFKAQAIFIAPFVITTLLGRRSPWWQWSIPFLVYTGAILPAWIAGWPAADLVTVYLRQAQYVPPNGVRFVSTASNWWALLANLDYGWALQSYWVGFTAAAVATGAYVWQLTKRPADLLVAAALSATMLPFLLPGMHERFYALAELSVFCLAWTCRSRRTAAAALLMQLQLLLAFFGWILRRPELTIMGAVLVTAVLWVLLRDLAGMPEDRKI